MAPHNDTISNPAAVSSAAPWMEFHRSSSSPSQDSTKQLPLTSDHRAGAHSPVNNADGQCQPSSSSITIPITLPLVSILKSSSCHSSQQQNREADGEADSDDQPAENDSSLPSHWPIYRPSVRFIDDPSNIHPSSSIVTSIHYRPYTPYSELAKLYYNSSDFARFKREYRALVKAQRRRSRDGGYSGDDAKSTGVLMKNSSFWRSTVHGRYYDASNSKFRSPSDDDNEECHSNGTGQLSTAALFSSVFDVAREAVSIFSGSSNYSYYQNQSPSSQSHSPMSKARQQQLVVDTLYLNLF